jgi:hypothetical protein
MKFTVYQIDLDDDQMENPELRNLYLDCIMKPDANTIRKGREFYSKVCMIDAVSFDHVFEIGNIGPENKIQRLSPMRSVSVGDVIRCNDTGVCKFVDSFGFGSISFGE